MNIFLIPVHFILLNKGIWGTITCLYFVSVYNATTPLLLSTHSLLTPNNYQLGCTATWTLPSNTIIN